MSKLRVILLSPFEMILCVAQGAWNGARDGAGNIRGAWRGATS